MIWSELFMTTPVQKKKMKNGINWAIVAGQVKTEMIRIFIKTGLS
jgi:hypothetical protein